MKIVPTKTTHLQMFSGEHLPPLPLPPDFRVVRCLKPSLSHYRHLYNSVGRDFHWIDRNLMPDEELQRIVQHDLVEVLTLLEGDDPRGFAELDRRVDNEVEIAYFGLFPGAIGKGLGKAFLNAVLQRAWSYHPRRVWVHTCDLDHPAALPLYQRAGFVKYDECIVQQVIEP